MSLEHTPGPWKVVHHNKKAPDLAYVQTGDAPYVGEICTVWSNEANAHLIAAAPDLLAALEQLAGCVASNNDADLIAALSAANVAVGKARGLYTGPSECSICRERHGPERVHASE